ncbi:hypothetical protein [Vibrio phage vB_VpaP_C2]|nr:hypothetical protein [Vibrio phage vB_VpaP_C2]
MNCKCKVVRLEIRIQFSAYDVLATTAPAATYPESIGHSIGLSVIINCLLTRYVL